VHGRAYPRRACAAVRQAGASAQAGVSTVLGLLDKAV